ncbi:FHA domain-containing protein [Candidatus Foliamicus sp.]
MPRVALEVNGAALVGAASRGVLFNEPGLAFVDKGRVLFGREAVAVARQDPGRSFPNFWELLSDKPLARPAPGFRTYADLVHAHLAELWDRFRESAQDVSEVVFVVPPGAADDRLALLLGIAEEAGLPVAALVESGVAAVGAIPAGRSCIFVDAEQEYLVAARLEQRRDRVHSAELLFSGRPGLRHLRAATTAYAASRFIAASRFDPLDLPDTEQELTENLDTWLEKLTARGEIKVELGAAPVPVSATLRASEFMTAFERQLAALGNRLRSWCSGSNAATVRLSATLAATPGCPEAFARLLPTEVQILKPGAAALGALARVPTAPSGTQRYVLLRSLTAIEETEDSITASITSQPNGAEHDAPAGVDGDEGMPTPTHLVLGGRAWRIDKLGLRLGSAPEPGGSAIALPPDAGISRNHCTVVLENGQALLHDHSRYGTRLNGAPVAESAPLRGGDRVGVGPVEFVVIREVVSDGT